MLHYLVLVTGCTSAGKIDKNEIYRVTNIETISMRGFKPDEERVAEIKKLLSCGTFYYAWSSDENVKPINLTLAQQKATKTDQTDNRFFW